MGNKMTCITVADGARYDVFQDEKNKVKRDAG